MTGGGFGGSSIALVQVDGVDAARHGILDAFAERGWTEPRSFVVTAGTPRAATPDPLGFWQVAENVGVHRREPAGTLDGPVGSDRCERQPPSPVPLSPPSDSQSGRNGGPISVGSRRPRGEAAQCAAGRLPPEPDS